MILKIENLKIKTTNRQIIDGLNLTLKEGEILGIVGESGSGKSLLCRSILKLNKEEIISSGSINYNNKNLLNTTEKEICKIRGREISIIFQEANAALNPLEKIGKQMSEVFYLHTKFKKQEIKNKIINLLNDVKIKNPERVMQMYPHEISGGMAQRILIAIAVALNPKIILADEPTTALDYNTEKEILDLIFNIVKKYNISLIIVSHDLKVIRYIADRVVVIKEGEIIENKDKKEFFENPEHPYSKYLIECSNLIFDEV